MNEPPRNDRNRTVIAARPNPGGRRPPPQPSQPPAQSFAPPPPYTAPTPPNPAGAPADAWAHAPERPAAAPEARAQPLPIRLDVPFAANENVMLQAAGPVLLHLARFRFPDLRVNLVDLKGQVTDAIRKFERTIRQAGVPQEQADLAKYALCATADDLVQNTLSDERPVWITQNMLTTFFGERESGVRFFEKLEQAKTDPYNNRDVLELMHACLALGFQGVHRTAPGGAAALPAIQRSLYELLHRSNAREDADLSPHWRGQDLPGLRPGLKVPFWAPCAVLASLVFALFVAASALLTSDSNALASEMRGLFPDSFLALERKPVPVATVVVPPTKPEPPPQQQPPPPPTQLQRIQTALADEIAAKKAAAFENGTSIIIRVADLVAFPSAAATVLDSFKPVGIKIAAALAKEPGDIRITGHTDNLAIFTVRFPSNYELSVERAKAVAAVLRPGIADQSRFKIEGKADTQPVAPNTTEEERARNRRVEISIPREETLRKP